VEKQLKAIAEGRFREVHVAPEVVASLIRRGAPGSAPTEPVVIPETAELVRSGYVGAEDVFRLVFAHDSFDPMAAGAEVPVVYPIFRVA